MKTILSVYLTLLVALAVLVGIAGYANALDAKTFYAQIDRVKANAAFCCEPSNCVCSAKDDWTAWGGAVRGLEK